MTGLSYAIIGLLVAIVIMTAVRGRRGLLSFTFISVVAIIGLYVFDLLQMPAHVRWYFLSPERYEQLLLLSFAFVVLFGSGERIGYSVGHSRSTPIDQVVYRRSMAQLAVVLFFISLIGQAIFVASSGGFTEFYGASHGSAGNFTSAYIYRLFHSMYAAAVILLAFTIKGERLSRMARIVLVVAIIVLLFDLITQGKRGGVIRFALMVAVPLVALDALTRRRMLMMLAGGVLAMALLVTLPFIRHATTLTTFGELDDAVGELSSRTEIYGSTEHLLHEGKHVVFAAIVVDGAMDVQEHNYGTRWIFPFVNLVPRAIWPDKPLRYEFAEDFYDISKTASNIYIPKGSFPGGIAESFSEWFWLVLGVWFVQGLVAGYVRGYATARKTAISLVLFYAVAVYHVHFMLQDAIQGIFSFMFLFGPFWVLTGIFKLLPRRGRVEGRRRLRGRTLTAGRESSPPPRGGVSRP